MSPDQKQINAIVEEQKKYLQDLNTIVEDSIKEERLILKHLLNPPTETLTRGQSLSDKVAQFGGSWKFIVSFLILLAIWIIFNIIMTGVLRFDPYPFILMNLVLSCIAALQAPIIMMSQNRKEEKDRKRAENDYLVNLKAEIEVRGLHQKIDLLFDEQIKSLYTIQTQQLELLQTILKKIEKK
jgi:uncharacterized membrane protein